MHKFTLYITSVILTLHQASGHGRFMEPPNRSSIWRDSRFNNYNPPRNYNDNQLFCGGRHQDNNPGTECGVCGDPIRAPTPRPNEIGGVWYKGIITGKYNAGQNIDVSAQITAAHMGFMEWRLCTDPSNENQSCFDSNLLHKVDGTGSKVMVRDPGWYRTTLRLPQGVTCDHCIIQWNYRAGNNWGWCDDGTGALGCGPQETFRGCSDISIV